MMRRLLSIRSDERGASLIELALAAPILSMLIMGMIDVSSGYSEKLQLEQAAQRSIEKAMQANREEIEAEDADFYASLKSEAALAAGVDQSKVTVRYWLECNGVSQNSSAATMKTDYEKKCNDGVPYSRHVNVRIEKTYTPMFKVDFIATGPDGTFTLVGEAGIRVQ